MKVLTVFDHPRRSSFCGAVLESLQQGLVEAGHVVEAADLRAEGFDPLLSPEDEPDWSDPKKVYSPEVLAEQARICRNDAIIFVFPVWWWSVPATTKGWIDRVWNHGWAYGAQKVPLQKARMVAVASSGAPDYGKRGYDASMRTQLLTGILNYCGVEDAGIDFLHGSLGDASLRAAVLQSARDVGRRF